MRLNELLLWLSARGQGSWEQFKAAVEELHLPEDQSTTSEPPPDEESRHGGLPLHQQLRLTLQRLGHAEFFAAGCEAGWRICPPVWATLGADHRPSAVLCGARTPLVLARVRSANVGTALLEYSDDGAAPTLYRLTAPDRGSLLSAATSTALPVSIDAPGVMLTALDPVCDIYEEVADMPMGRDWVVEEFDADSLRWKMSSRDMARTAVAGLFRFRLSYQRRHFLRQRGLNFEMDGAAAKYALLRRRRRSVIKHSADSGECVIPASCRPPLLVERALILCSGQLPSFNGADSTLTYRNISREIVRLAATVLNQEVR